MSNSTSVGTSADTTRKAGALQGILLLGLGLVAGAAALNRRR